MTRVAYVLLLGVSLAFVLAVSSHSNDTDNNSVESQDVVNQYEENEEANVDQSDESDDSDESEDSDESDDSDDEEDSDEDYMNDGAYSDYNQDEEDSDEDYMNDGAYSDYNQDEEDTEDKEEMEEEKKEAPGEEEPSHEVPLPPCKPDYFFQQIEQVCATYRDKDITELEKKCKDIDTAVANIRDLIFQSDTEANLMIEKDDTTWTQKLSHPSIVPKKQKPIEILFDRAVDEGISDCNDAGQEKPGVYLLNVEGSPYTIRAFCVKGWTVVQRRFDGSEDFDRDFDDYLAGFGNFSGEFFLGLENLHRLTKDKAYTLRIDAKGSTGKWYYGVYEDFSLSDELDGYRISLGNMTAGNYLDGFENARSKQFSTRDRDNDDWRGGNCAEHYGGGWWSSTCSTNLNQMWCRSGCMRWAAKHVVSSIIRIKPSSDITEEDLSENPNPGGLTLDNTPAQ